MGFCSTLNLQWFLILWRQNVNWQHKSARVIDQNEYLQQNWQCFSDFNKLKMSYLLPVCLDIQYFRQGEQQLQKMLRIINKMAKAAQIPIPT